MISRGVGMTAAMRFDRIRDVSLIDLDGTPLPVHRVIERETLLILIGLRHLRLDRAAVEIAWMMERLPADIGVVVVWPSDTIGDSIEVALPSSVRVMRDGARRLQRLVAPNGSQVIMLANPVLDSLEVITSDHPLFLIRYERPDGASYGTDRTLDLGDMQQ